jgi:hypothetical protein
VRLGHVIVAGVLGILAFVVVMFLVMVLVCGGGLDWYDGVLG